MPQLVKKRRSGWAVLAVGALVASIFAVAAGPVSAQQPISRDASPNNNPDWGASWSACVGAAGSHDAMFSDVARITSTLMPSTASATTGSPWARATARTHPVRT